MLSQDEEDVEDVDGRLFCSQEEKGMISTKIPLSEKHIEPFKPAVTITILENLKDIVTIF